MAGFRELGAAWLQLVRDPRGAPPPSATAQQVSVLDADGRVAVIQAQHYRLYNNNTRDLFQVYLSVGENI